MAIELRQMVARTELSLGGNAEGSPELAMRLYGKAYGELQEKLLDYGGRLQDASSEIASDGDDAALAEVVGMYSDLIELAFGQGTFGSIVGWAFDGDDAEDADLIVLLSPIVGWIADTVGKAIGSAAPGKDE